MSRGITEPLRVVCERTHRFREITGSVNEPKSNDLGTIAGTHYLCIIWNLSVKGARACATELADVLTSIFNLSLSQSIIPTCFKTTNIVPLPKKSPPTCLNYYRPVPLTPIIMKCFERVVLTHIQSSMLDILDPLQYAYWPNRSTSDKLTQKLIVLDYTPHFVTGS